jgi:hypothetical protein
MADNVNRGQATSRKDFEASIISKAWRDPNYLARLRNNPNAVVQEELALLYPGAKLPVDFNVSVHEEDPKHVHIVLPVNPAVVDQTLTDEDLDQAAGGTGIGVVVAVVAGAVANTGGAVNQVAGGNINVVANVNVNANVSVNMNQTTTT